jgi:hypothetical protein
VTKVGAAVVGVVEHVHVAGAHPAGVAAGDDLDALAHRPEVDGHVRRVGDQPAAGVEHRAGEVEPLLDVDRVGGGLQPHPHLLGDRHEQVVEDLEHHRVHRGPGRRPAGPGLDPRQQQVAPPGQLRPPARLDHGGREVLHDQGRAGHPLAGTQVPPPGQPRPRPPATGIQQNGCFAPTLLPGPRRRPRRSPGRVRQDRCGQRRGGGGELDRHGLGDDRLVAHEEGEELPVRLLEVGQHLGQRAERHRQGGVGALVPQVGPAHVTDPVRPRFVCFAWLAWRLRFCRAGRPGACLHECRQRVGGEGVGHPVQLGQQASGQRRLDRPLPHRGHVGQAHPVRGQHAGQRVDQHLGDAQRVGDRARVLAAGPAERRQHVPGDVIAALD